MNGKVDFEYKPSKVESMFAMDEKTSEIQKILKQDSLYKERISRKSSMMRTLRIHVTSVW